MNVYHKAWSQGNNLLGWVGRVCRDSFRAPGAPVDIMFCMVDHYEPFNPRGEVESRQQIDRLVTEYPRLVEKHKDSDNCLPKRTWFFPPHNHKFGILKDLVSLCAQSYGEIELHLHHGKTVPDDEQNLRQTIEQTLLEYSAFGIFGHEDGKRRYGFIHGDWALDNSRNGRFCGVNSEITILKQTGCYADFTFPSNNEASPRKINSIYYATDDPQKPKSHDSGRPVKRGVAASGDLMIVEGPTHPYFIKPGLGGLRVIGDSVDIDRGPDNKRIDCWVRTAVHVLGKRNWVFIKVHTHGATNLPVVLGKPMDQAFSYLEERYNDGKQFRLHYVTARELYNIVKAAEAGESGENPSAFRDYKIQKPNYDPSANASEASEKLQSLIAKTYKD